MSPSLSRTSISARVNSIDTIISARTVRTPDGRRRLHTGSDKCYLKFYINKMLHVLVPVPATFITTYKFVAVCTYTSYSNVSSWQSTTGNLPQTLNLPVLLFYNSLFLVFSPIFLERRRCVLCLSSKTGFSWESQWLWSLVIHLLSVNFSII